MRIHNQIKRNLSRIFKICYVTFKISFLPGVRRTRRVVMPFLEEAYAGSAPPPHPIKYIGPYKLSK